MRSGAAHACLCRPLSSATSKNIPLYRNSVSAYVSSILIRRKGRSYVVSNRGSGSGGRRQRRAREAGAGRDEPREVPAACGRAALKRTAKSRGPGCRCYSQALRRCAEPNRARRAVNPRDEGGQRKGRLPGERAIRRQTSRREGRTFPASPVIRCALRVHSHRTTDKRVPAGARPSLRPFIEGVTRSARLGRKALREGEGASASEMEKSDAVASYSVIASRLSCRGHGPA